MSDRLPRPRAALEAPERPSENDRVIAAMEAVFAKTPARA